MLDWIVIFVAFVAVAAWLALDCWMGWTAAKLDAAIREFEEEWRRGIRTQPFDWVVLGAMVYVLALLLFRSG